jgi:hypothetical protein
VHVGPEALLAGPGPAARRGIPAETPTDQHPAAQHHHSPGTREPTPAPAADPGRPPSQPAVAPAGVPAETPGDPPAGTAADAARRPAGHPARTARCHLDDGPAISPAAVQALACHATVSWMLAACHDAQITTDTIIPAGLADKLDLDLAIWACLANARLDQEPSQQEDQHPAA